MNAIYFKITSSCLRLWVDFLHWVVAANNRTNQARNALSSVSDDLEFIWNTKCIEGRTTSKESFSAHLLQV